MPTRRPLQIVTLAVVLALAGACGNDDSGAASPPRTGPTAPDDEVPNLPPARIAPLPEPGAALDDGAHLAFVTDLDLEGMTIVVDVVQWFVGAEADAAFEEETGDPGGAPNDYFIRNASLDLRTLPLSRPEVTVAWDRERDLPNPRGVPIEELPDYLERADPLPFWITVDDGTVVRLDEQYLP